MERMKECMICPRKCDVDRISGETGYCGETSETRIARAALHFWEEPCISGDAGSGTVFFTGCSLRCVYCQNHDIAHKGKGREVSIERLSEIFLELQEKGALNINLVTPTHFSPQIIESIGSSRNKGLSIPIIYNTGGYEETQSIRMLEGIVDVYLTDLKYFNADLAKRYSNAPDYFEKASTSLEEMVKQKPEIVFDERGIIQSGVVVRHLVLPGHNDDSQRILEYLHRRFGEQIIISIMNQYTPLSNIGDFPDLNRKVTKKEYKDAVDFAWDIGIRNCFIQEGETAEESFIPNFNNEGV